jgi:hypothetical protein
MVTDARQFLVFTNPVKGREDEYNKWYDNQHLHDVVAVEGVTAARRYEVVPNRLTGEPTHLYLAVYDLEGDLDATLDGFSKHRADGRMPLSDSMDMTNLVRSIWSPRGPTLHRR